MTKQFTGWHITGILIAFFGVVIAVNLWLAIAARSTFGGALAENGYVASQDYNKWIAASEAQDRLGWSVAASADKGRLILAVSGVESPEVVLVLQHPLGREPERRITMQAIDPTHFVSVEGLPPGRWRAHVDLVSQGHRASFLEDVTR